MSRSNGVTSASGSDAATIRAVGENLAVDERHHDVHQAVLRLAEPDDVADVRVREPHAERRLATQPRHRVRVLRQRGRQHLDRVALARRDVVGEVDERHAAFADLLHDLVVPLQRLADEVLMR